MTWSDTWLPAARTALIELRGESAPSDYGGGLPLPLISVADAHALVSLATKPFVRVLGRDLWAGSNGVVAIPEHYVDGDGMQTGPSSEGYSAADYLATPRAYILTSWSSVAPREPWFRQPSSAPEAYTIFDPPQLVGGFSDGAGVKFRRDAISAWQEIVDAIASASTQVASTAEPMELAMVEAVWHPLARLCTALDVLMEIPPPPPLSSVLADAANATAHDIGKLVADTANTAGNIGASIVSGVIEGIGPIAAGVGVLAVYLALK